MKSLNKQPSESSVYIWNIAGSIANALLSVVLLMLVTRTLDDKQADIFSVAWTISQLMVTIGTFQIRTYQATDVKGVFKFQQYFIFRILTISVMMLCGLGDVYKRQAKREIGFGWKGADLPYHACQCRLWGNFDIHRKANGGVRSFAGRIRVMFFCI